MTVDAYTVQQGYYIITIHTVLDVMNSAAAFQFCWLESESIKKKKRSFIFKDCHLLVINALCVIVRNLGLLNESAINPSIGLMHNHLSYSLKSVISFDVNQRIWSDLKQISSTFIM